MAYPSGLTSSAAHDIGATGRQNVRDLFSLMHQAHIEPFLIDLAADEQCYAHETLLR